MRGDCVILVGEDFLVDGILAEELSVCRTQMLVQLGPVFAWWLAVSLIAVRSIVQVCDQLRQSAERISRSRSMHLLQAARWSGLEDARSRLRDPRFLVPPLQLARSAAASV